jgi:hypothetical protein
LEWLRIESAGGILEGKGGITRIDLSSSKTGSIQEPKKMKKNKKRKKEKKK